MKFFLSTLYLLTLLIFISGCSTNKRFERDDKTKYNYFRIFADVADDPVFIKIQDEIGIDPKLERFVLIVNIKEYIVNKYVQIGDIEDPGAVKFSWQQLSEEVRYKLINWTGSNKENLDN
jgi:hypothetical protein